MNSTIIGTRFEKYFQLLLRLNDVGAERNIMYHKGGRKYQVDIEYETGFLFKDRFIAECKYVSPGSSFDFGKAYSQLGEVLLFTGCDNGIIVTNSVVKSRKKKEEKYKVQLYDLSVLLALRCGETESLEKSILRVDEEIRSMPYDKEVDHKFRHCYL